MMNEKIIVVEDEEDIRELIHFHLFKNKYDVIEASNGSEALSLAKEHSPKLMLLDIMIPEIDGIEVCRRIKEDPKLKDTKIIFISAKGSEEDIIKGLELGADDYITKPFSPKILMARVKTVLRRGVTKPKSTNAIHGIEIDNSKRKVMINNEEVVLTESEYQVLKLFVESPGMVFTRSQIVNNIRGHNHAVTDRSVDTLLVSLRKKMGDKGKLIETVWGVGYRFKELED